MPYFEPEQPLLKSYKKHKKQFGVTVWSYFGVTFFAVQQKALTTGIIFVKLPVVLFLF